MLTRQTPGEIFNKKNKKTSVGRRGRRGGALYSVYLQGMTLILNSSSRCTGQRERQRERGSEAQTMENMSGFFGGGGGGVRWGGDQ